MNSTKIRWATVTWNPVFGCSKVSAGFRHCYAEQLALRFGHSKRPWTARNVTDNVVLKPHKLREPYKLKEPSLIFVNSMSDLFHEVIPDEYIRQIFKVMHELSQHQFLILTKRPERAAGWPGPWTNNICMGASVEDERVLHRVETLRACPAHVRFLSLEPLIGPIENVDLSGYDWAIVGGESGRERRPMPHAWARRLLKLCQEQGVAYFFKQSAAPRTEMGIALRHEDGSFWVWSQYPGRLVPPQPGAPHRFTDE